MIKLPELVSQDEDEMRAFYASFGMSKGTTEAAIQAMRTRRAEQKKMKTRTALPAQRAERRRPDGISPGTT